MHNETEVRHGQRVEGSPAATISAGEQDAVDRGKALDADAATRDAANRWAAEVLAETVPECSRHPFELDLLRSGAKRLAIVHADAAPLVLKQYGDDRGAWTAQWLRRLADAGLTPPATDAVTLPRGWSERHRTLVTEIAPGQSWSEWTLAGPARGTGAAIAAARWLVRLQSLTVDLPVRTDHRAEREMHTSTTLLADRFPQHAERLRALEHDVAHRLYAAPGEAAAVPLVASHGDLHPNNLHLELDEATVTALELEAPTVTALDLDTAGLRRPSYDVGYAIAQLLILSWLRTGSLLTGARSASAFWGTWRASGTDADAVPAEIARALIQSLHFELITYATGRSELIEVWLTIAEVALAGDLFEVLHSFASDREVVR
ncbi:hypothetical protein [Agrococcus sp. Ld7]|uniref:hypothetical protein n=1 Tax=Agrococcus sp. Ld7 TaxID=649148 RepID=UPI0038636C03